MSDAINRELSLLKSLIGQNDDQNELKLLEKLPRPSFPLCYMVFKAYGKQEKFEVFDISFSGMQLKLNHLPSWIEVNNKLEGELHWYGDSLKLKGEIIWFHHNRLGLKFENDFHSAVESFLSPKNVADKMISVRERSIDGVEIPPHLKVWLFADGPFNVYLWQDSGGNIKSFEVMAMEHYIVWHDLVGIQSSRILSKRNIETPLFDSQEFLIRRDQECDSKRLEIIRSYIKELPPQLLSIENKNFLLLKLS